ncbi:MAG: twin transmembrane helix small protein [Rhodobacteraceae bacterium]|nr:twin transmembrane helix small protein [Paracoccaceae bacterium]MCY4195777.1 twin transmembrane helix small protein [Paracoccaceae bacterium]MCY4328452.1 twin transmembrane helix small protein [Paracoccaceae bacterium]
MRGDPFFIAAAVASLAVVVVLAIGIGGYARGGEFNRKYANRLMRLRILTQAIAVLLICLFVFMKGR